LICICETLVKWMQIWPFFLILLTSPQDTTLAPKPLLR
jgi:hypothetical protein